MRPPNSTDLINPVDYKIQQQMHQSLLHSIDELKKGLHGTAWTRE